MLSTGETFNPSDLIRFDIPVKLKAQQEQKAVKQAMNFLKPKGITQIT